MRLYIGHLHFDCNEQDLRDAFGRFGEVLDATVIIDRATGRSRGFGFVTFTSREDGERAVAALNGAVLFGREIRVNEARPFRVHEFAQD